MATIDDVAKLAEVSKGTVSNVFSKKRPISKQVSERVLEAARQLNYVPNHVARSLAIKQTNIIGLKMPLPQQAPISGFEFQLMNGVIKECNRNGYRLLLDSFPEQEEDVTLFSKDPVDGVIMLNPRVNDARLVKYRQQQVPLVIIGRPSPMDSSISYVDNNNEQMALEAGRFLFKNGHRSVLFLNACEDMTVAEDRQKGFSRAFHEWGLSAEHNPTFYYKRSRYNDVSDYGYASIMKTYIAMDYTAVIADTDRVAFGVMRAARELGIGIPKELSVIALNNDNILAQECVPQLTCIDLFPEMLGIEAAKQLFRQILGDEATPGNVIIDARFVLRDSCSTKAILPVKNKANRE